MVMILAGFSALFALGFLAAFVWAVKSGQFSDNATPALRILVDDKEYRTSSRLENGTEDGLESNRKNDASLRHE